MFSTLAILHVKPKFKRGLEDTTTIVGGNNCTVTGKEVEFAMEFEGFDKIPSRILWLHNGKPIDPTKWAVSVSPSATRITSDSLKPVDEEQYTCQVSDVELGVNLQSNGKVALRKKMQTILLWMNCHPLKVRKVML